jgi:carboxyl-terminal processing protease
MKKWLLLVFSLFGFSAQAITPEASAYLETAIGHLERNFLRTDQINWQAVRKGSQDLAKDAKTFRDTYPAIRWAISQLQEPHSFFLEPEPVATSRAPALQVVPTSRQIGRIGYVNLPAHGSNGSLVEGTYQDTVHDAIRNLDEQNVCGWIVDLSNNGGGNMYPMIAGLGALLGEGEHGLFLGAKKAPLYPWGYRSGASFIGSTPLARVQRPYQLKTANAPVAVLISNLTASSGEATAISFIGRSNTRFFGTATSGFTTGNIGMPLEDNAVLVITSTEMADRTAKTYDKIRPDERASWLTLNDTDHPAIRWLLAQPNCQPK